MNITILGSGLMGSSVAERFLKKSGIKLTVYNRTLFKAKPLEEKGAFITDESRKAIEMSECLVLFLADAAAIEQAVFANNDILEGKTIIQMGTISTEESILFNDRALKARADYLECPVLGSKNEALSGSLILMVGSTEEQFLKWKEFLSFLGPDPKYMGEVGKAAALKIALNHLIASYAVSFSLSLGIVQKKGIDVDIFSEILKQSSLYAPMFDKKLHRWLKGDYKKPNFPLKHLLKDVDLVIHETDVCGLSNESVKAVRKIILKGLDKGLGESDYSSLFEAVKNKKTSLK